MSCQCKTDEQRSKCIWWIPKEAGLPFHSNPVQDVPDGPVTLNRPDKVVYGCFPDVVAQYLAYMISYIAGAQQGVEQARDEIAKGFNIAVPVMQALTTAVKGKDVLRIKDPKSR